MSLLNKVLTFAAEQGQSEIKDARSRLRVEGALQAARDKGISEVKASTPWYERAFGGGAKLSGAMAMHEQQTILDYNNNLQRNMETLRTMTPEEFETQQLDALESMKTGDEEMDARLMTSGTVAMKDAVRVHAKAHDGYVQEEFSKAATGQALAGLEGMDLASQGDDFDRDRAAEQLGQVLAKPEGMTDSTYEALQESLAVTEAEEYGTTYVLDNGINNGTLATAAQLGKTHEIRAVAEGRRVERESKVLGVRMADLFQSTADLTKSEAEIFAQADALFTEYPSAGTPAVWKSLSDAMISRVTTKQGDADLAAARAFYSTGKFTTAPLEYGKFAQQLMEEDINGARESGDYTALFSRLKTVSEPSKRLKQDWTTAFLATTEVNEAGQPVASVQQIQLFGEMKEFKEKNPSLYYRTITQEDAQKFEIADTALRNGDSSDPAVNMARAVAAVGQAMTNVDKVGTKIYLTKDERPVLQEAVTSAMDKAGLFTGDVNNDQYVENQVMNRAVTYQRMYGGNWEGAVEASLADFHSNNTQVGNTQVSNHFIQRYFPVPTTEFSDVVQSGLPEGVDLDDVLISTDPSSGRVSYVPKDDIRATPIDMPMGMLAKEHNTVKEIDQENRVDANTKKEQAILASKLRPSAWQYIAETQYGKYEDRPGEMFFQKESEYEALVNEQMQGMSDLKIIELGNKAMNAGMRTGGIGFRMLDKIIQAVPGLEWTEDINKVLKAVPDVDKVKVKGVIKVAQQEKKFMRNIEEMALQASRGESLMEKPSSIEAELTRKMFANNDLPDPRYVATVAMPKDGLSTGMRSLLKSEGAKAGVYMDTAGVGTIGVGIALAKGHVTQETMQWFEENLGITADKFPAKGGDYSAFSDVKLSGAQALDLFKVNANRFLKKAQKEFKDNDEVWDVMMRMSFQIGTGVYNWKATSHLKRALGTGLQADYDQAVAEYVNSQWFSNHPKRAGRILDDLVNAVGRENFGSTNYQALPQYGRT